MLQKEQIMEIIPHRPPMLLVDTITELWENGAKGELHLSGAEFFFQGHFPGDPIMPAVFQLEALAQVGAVAILSQESNRGKKAFYTSIDKAKFRRMVHPGEVLCMEIELVKQRGPLAVAHGKTFVDGELASEAEIKCFVGGESASGE